MSGVCSFIDLCRGFFGKEPTKKPGTCRELYSAEGDPVELGLGESNNIIVRFGDLSQESEAIVLTCAEKISAFYTQVIAARKDLHLQSLVFEIPEAMSFKIMGTLLPAGLSPRQEQILTPSQTQYATRTQADFHTKKTRLWVWLDTEHPCTISDTANKHVSATAVVVNQLGQERFVYLIRSPSESPFWRVPGGPCERLEDPQLTAWRHFSRESGLTIPSSFVSRVQLVSQVFFPNHPYVDSLSNCYAFFINNWRAPKQGLCSLEVLPNAQQGWFNVREVTACTKDSLLNGFSILETVIRVIRTALTSTGFQHGATRSGTQVWCARLVEVFPTATQTEEIPKQPEESES